MMDVCSNLGFVNQVSMSRVRVSVILDRIAN